MKELRERKVLTKVREQGCFNLIPLPNIYLRSQPCLSLTTPYRRTSCPTPTRYHVLTWNTTTIVYWIHSLHLTRSGRNRQSYHILVQMPRCLLVLEISSWYMTGNKYDLMGLCYTIIVCPLSYIGKQREKEILTYISIGQVTCSTITPIESHTEDHAWVSLHSTSAISVSHHWHPLYELLQPSHLLKSLFVESQGSL